AMAKAGTRGKVSAAEVASAAYGIVFSRLNMLFDLAWLPLLILLAATILPGYLRLYRGLPGLPSWAGAAFGVSFETIVEAVVGLLCLSAFAVRWYQALLAGAGWQVPQGIFLRAWLRFLAYIVLVYAVAAALMTVILLTGVDGAPAFLAP